METHSTAHLKYKPAIMGEIKHITIPQPCHQSWQQMEIKESGRHCLHCAKIVIDFTKMTNNEILAYLAGAVKVCGRLSHTQLSDINSLLKVEEPAKALNWRRWVIAASLFSAGVVGRVSAQTKPAGISATEQAPADSGRKSMAPADSLSGKPVIYHVSGVLIGSDDKLPLAGASVRIKGTDAGATTDRDGCFSLIVQKQKAVLVVSYIGYEAKEVKVSFAKNSDLNIMLKINPMVSGGLVITRESRMSRTEMLYQYIPWPINRLFK